MTLRNARCNDKDSLYVVTHAKKIYAEVEVSSTYSSPRKTIGMCSRLHAQTAISTVINWLGKLVCPRDGLDVENKVPKKNVTIFGSVLSTGLNTGVLVRP